MDQNKKRCIHGRTENQRCALCFMRSQCCEGAVYRKPWENGYEYVCETCKKTCDIMRK